MVTFLNYSKVSEHEDAKRNIEGVFTNGLELIGPLFFLIL
jgi:hypothetical protein